MINYSRDFLDQLSQETQPDLFKETVQNLINKVNQNENITLAEEKFLCSVLYQLRNDNNEKAFKIENLDYCMNYYFKSVYLKYFHDLNGHKPILDFNGEVPSEIKKKEVEYLENVFFEWKKLIEINPNKNDILSFLIQEFKIQIKELEKFVLINKIGSRYKNYLIKSLTLHSKYIYLTVKEAFQEYKTEEFLININGQEILINPFCYVHTLFRHYAQTIKEHQLNKSYHFDEFVDFKNIPKTIEDVFICLKSSITSEKLSNRIYFEFNKQIYALWLKELKYYEKKKPERTVLRVQTFYPVKNINELDNVKKLKYLKSNCDFNFWL